MKNNIVNWIASKTFSQKLSPLIFLLLSAILPQQQSQNFASAADVQSNLSTQETYVGLPTVLRVAINNAVEHDTPVFPDVAGLTIESAGPPSRNSQTSWINGRKSQRTSIIYSFLITPNEEGVFTIPPIPVTADGVTTMTQAVKLVATKSETGDLLFAEISGNQSSIYVGESLDLTLKFWIRPYRNQEYRVALNEEEMWQCVADSTSWGMFEDRMSELAQERKRPGGRSVLRADAEGTQREFILYEITTTIYPDRAGTIDAQDTRLILNYPVTLGRSRSPLDIFSGDDFFSGTPFGNSGFGSFGSRLTITESRPIVADIEVQPIEVLPIPTQGRPKSYVGAVGNYLIDVKASPTQVRVGDPITLSINIQGDGPMDVLRAPALSRQAEIAENFKVGDESIAGIINGNKKTFTTTLRPNSAEVKEIPAIEYSFFNPETESFATITSEPILLEVEEAEILALPQTGSAGNRVAANERNLEKTDVLGQRNKIKLFESESAIHHVTKANHWSGLSLTALFLPPCIFALATLFRHRSSLNRLLPASYHFRKSLSHTDTLREVNGAIEIYLRQKLKTPNKTCSRSMLVGEIRKSGQYRIAERIERLFQSEANAQAVKIPETREEACEIIASLESSGISKRNNAAGCTTQYTLLVLATTLSFMLSQNSLQAEEEKSLVDRTTTEQRTTILAEACQRFSDGLNADSPNEANKLFSQSATSLESLVTQGIQNDQLYFNLAETYRQLNRHAEAVAFYRSALNLQPLRSLYWDRLRSLETELQEVDNQDSSLNLNGIKRMRESVISLVGLRNIDNAFWASWLMLWIVAFACVFIDVKGKRTILTSLVGICLITGYLTNAQVFDLQNEDVIILAGSSIEVREGDGEEFPLIRRIDDSQGLRLKRLQNRGDWVLVQYDADQQGWIHRNDTAVITTAGPNET
jgi:tetratricopeptide (TPR) repeat protein